MKTRFELVGLSRERLDPAYTDEKLQKWLPRSRKLYDNTEEAKRILVWEGGLLLFELYLLGDDTGYRERMPTIVDYAEDYFFGKWRDQIPAGSSADQPPDREYQDRNRLWASEFLQTSLWCTCMGHWDGLQRFASFVRDDVTPDPDQTTENRAWLIHLAGALRDRPWDEMGSLREVIQNGRPKREKLLLNLLDAILHDSERDLQKKARDYLKYYKKTEAKGPKLTSKVTLDGSLLIHYAAHLGRLIEVPEPIQVHILPRFW